MSDLAALVLDAIAADPSHLARLQALIGNPDPVDTGPDWLTVPEAAEHLRCKPQRIYDLAHQRRLPYVKDGSRVLISRADVDHYLNANRQEADAA